MRLVFLYSLVGLACGALSSRQTPTLITRTNQGNQRPTRGTPQSSSKPRQSPKKPAQSPESQRPAWKKAWAETSDSSADARGSARRLQDTVTEVSTKGRARITHKRYGQNPEIKESSKKARTFTFHGNSKSRTKVSTLEPQASAQLSVHGGTAKIKVDQRYSRHDGTVGLRTSEKSSEAMVDAGEKSTIHHDATEVENFATGTTIGGTIRGEITPKRTS